jgi:imidazolonepropionase-like amidohydrolase
MCDYIVNGGKYIGKFDFKGGFLIDGSGKNPVDNSLVLVDGKKISYAGKIVEFSDDYEVIDIYDKVIMPGLIDIHLHFSGNLSDNDSEWVLEPIEQKAVVAVSQAREALLHGLTSVGEISRFRIHIRNMIEQGIIEGPRVVATGLGFCRTAGHGDSHKLLLGYTNISQW